MGCNATGWDSASPEVRHVVLFTFRRHGSSLTTARLAEAMHGAALPLFELFNLWPFATLNFYSSDIFTKIKMLVARELVAPRIGAFCSHESPLCAAGGAFSSDVRLALASDKIGDVMHGLKTISTTPLGLGRCIQDDWSGTLRLAQRAAITTRHRWLVFKLMKGPNPPHNPDGLVRSVAADPRAVVVRLRRNFFHAYVSEIKIETPDCGSGHSATEMHGPACVPPVNLTHFARAFTEQVRQSEAWAQVVGGSWPEVAKPWRATDGRAALISLWYEELEHMDSATMLSVLRQRLEAAVGDPAVLGCPGTMSVKMAGRTYDRQDKASNLRDKVSNYEELARYYKAERPKLCASTGVPTCGRDPEFDMPRG